jgi:hypothetical protein
MQTMTNAKRQGVGMHKAYSYVIHVLWAKRFKIIAPEPTQNRGTTGNNTTTSKKGNIMASRKVISKNDPNIRALAADLKAATKKQAPTREEKFKQEAAEYAASSVANIREMVEALQAAGDDDTKREDAETAIHEDALSVEVRSGWYSPGDTDAAKPAEYNILITTGGPAARIVGDLDQYGQPTNARFEYQDWFQPWTEVPLQSKDTDILLTYAQQFYFGED